MLSSKLNAIKDLQIEINYISSTFRAKSKYTEQKAIIYYLLLTLLGSDTLEVHCKSSSNQISNPLNYYNLISSFSGPRNGRLKRYLQTNSDEICCSLWW